MIASKEDIINWDSTFRLKFMNSASGYKGVHLIGTRSESGVNNLGLFNSIVHISSNPAQIGFILRPNTVRRDTYNNILANKHYTINQVHKSFLQQAHYTSAKFEENESEFERCHLEPHFKKGFQAPMVAKSKVKIGLSFADDILIKGSDCHLIVGNVEFLEIDNELIEEDGQLNFEPANTVCVTGLNQYSSVRKHMAYPYARVSDLPEFGQKKRPDNVAFDEETQSYVANILPYATNLGAPVIKSNDMTTWKNRNVSGYNHILKDKINKVKEEYEALVEEYKINEMLYSAAFGFEPNIGETYHLYSEENQEKQFLSLIAPETWPSKQYLGSFVLQFDKTWKKVEHKPASGQDIQNQE